MLSSLRVLDLTDESGFLCPRILADLGADVVKVEPPGGEPSRHVGPYLGEGEDPDRSVYWHAYNANKRGITLDLRRPRGRELFLRLAEGADCVVETFAPGWLAEIGLDYDTLSRRNPRLIHVAITPFGRTGPRASYRGSDVVVWAMGGAMSLAGERAGEPLRISLAQSPMWAGMHAAKGAMLALAARHLTGRGQFVDVSAQASVITALAAAPWFWDVLREDPLRDGVLMGGRSVTGARMRVFWPCLDGYVTFIIYGGHAGQQSNRGLTEWMAERGMAPDWMRAIDWSMFDVRTQTQAEIDRLEAPIGAFLRTVRKAEFGEEAFRRHILGYAVATAADIAAHPQLEAREFWREVGQPGKPEEPPLRFPGPFARFETWDAGVRRPAPHVGEHNREVFAGELGLSEAELAAAEAEGVV